MTNFKPETLLLHGGQDVDPTGSRTVRFIAQRLTYLIAQSMRVVYSHLKREAIFTLAS